jgi:uncharacterized membrane protein
MKRSLPWDMLGLIYGEVMDGLCWVIAILAFLVFLWFMGVL